MAAPAEPISAADLVVLLYRADWTRLSLSATVREHLDRALLDKLCKDWGTRRHGRTPDQPPPWWPGWLRRPWHDQPEHDDPEDDDPEEPVGESSHRLLLAPGGRYRLEPAAGDESGLIVSDGQSRWHISEGAAERSRADGPARAAELLLPADLLTRFDFEVTGTSQAGGRVAHRVTACVRPDSWTFSGQRERLLDQVLILVDAELGILLRYEEVFGGQRLKLVELADVVLDPPEALDPALFLPPAGMPVTDSPPFLRSNAAMPGPAGQVVRTAAGLVGSAMGFAVRHTGPRPPRWVGDEPWPSTGESTGAGGGPLGDDLVRLLHRTVLPPLALSADVHEWHDTRVSMAGMAELRASLPTALDGILGPDAVWDALADRAPEIAHTARRLRIATPGRYRIDRLTGEGQKPETIVCDGERLWRVYHNRVATGPAEPLRYPYGTLLDLAWLLGAYALSAGGETEVDGRPGLLVRADPQGEPGHRLLRWGGSPLFFFPGRAEVIVDAELGVALRETTYVGDEPESCYELRNLTAGAPDPAVFVVDVPPGTRTVGTGLVGEMGLASPVTVATTAARLGLLGAAALTGWLQKRPARNEPPTTDHDPSDHNV
jgi:outer membrane lipoprotein-sorting protein